MREPDEYDIAKVEGVPLLPLSELSNRFTELDPNQQYYLHCKAGVRSLKALSFLKQQGFKYVKSVKGGISAWSDEIDSQRAEILSQRPVTGKRSFRPRSPICKAQASRRAPCRQPIRHN